MKQYKLSNILRKVLENIGIPESYYSIGKYKEGAICIEKVGKVYVVYDAKRAEKYIKKECENELEACKEIIRRITKGNNKDFEIINQEFHDTRAKEVLKQVFDNEGIPGRYYSLEGYAEEAVCIEKNNKNYIVYTGERGNKYNVSKHSDISKSLLNLISKVTQNYEQEERVVEAFINKLYKTV